MPSSERSIHANLTKEASEFILHNISALRLVAGSIELVTCS